MPRTEPDQGSETGTGLDQRTEPLAKLEPDRTRPGSETGTGLDQTGKVRGLDRGRLDWTGLDPTGPDWKSEPDQTTDWTGLDWTRHQTGLAKKPGSDWS